MTDVTQLLNAIDRGDAGASEALLPLVYEELRRLAQQKMRNERAGHTLQATALVHEAFLRLVGSHGTAGGAWNSRNHFFAAAAEAMRRILVESARRRRAAKRGGDGVRHEVQESMLALPAQAAEVIAIHDVLDQFAEYDPVAAELVKLRFFAGLTMQDAAGVLNLPVRTAQDVWAYARAWLKRELRDEE